MLLGEELAKTKVLTSGRKIMPTARIAAQMNCTTMGMRYNE
jgi:hypothetical protein